MTFEVNPQILAIFIAGFALLFAGGTFWRAGDWRKSDTWKTLTDSVSAMGHRVTNVESRTGELPTKISSINDRLTRVEKSLEDMPSKSDIAELRAKLDAQGDEIDVVRDTVVRIEGYMIGGKQ